MQRREALARVTYREGFHSGLWLERFPPDGIDGRLTDIETESFVGEACRFQMPEDYTPFYEAWKGELAATGAIGRVYRCAKGSRLLVGLGAASLLENSVALHPVYGTPWIRGSQLKGVAARRARRDPGTEWIPGGRSYDVLFGSKSSAGYGQFFDALAIPKPGRFLRKERLTVHHQKYYGEGKSPSGRESPVPVAYLSVRCDFMIFVAGPPAWCEAAFELVNLALNEEGIGAKTRFRAFGRMAAADDGE